MRTMLLRDAEQLADEIFSILYPYCERLQIVGSIRRRSPLIGDIDFACVPRAGLNGHGIDQGFIDIVHSYPKIIGSPSGKFTKRLLPGGSSFDLSMGRKDNFGTLVAFRTGSVEFYKRVIVARIAALGFKIAHSDLFDQHGNHLAAYDEQEFFNHIKEPYRVPELRAF